MLPARRRLSSQPQFTPRKIFAAMRGAWLEPVLGNMWQENTGITPVSAPGHPVGLLLDQSQGMVLGPELVANGEFNSSNGWTPGTGWSITDGVAVATNAPISSLLTNSGQVVAGNTYLVSYKIISSGDTNGICFQGGETVSSIYHISQELGTFTEYFLALTTGSISMRIRIGTHSCSIDNVSVCQVLGNHAYQTTAANRPTYQLDANSLPLIRHDTNDVLTVSLPNLGGGVFSNSGSVYFATPQGMRALHDKSMGTSYNLPALSTDVYAWCVTPARLNAAQEARLERYFLRKAGIATPDYITDENGNILTDDLDIPLLAG